MGRVRADLALSTARELSLSAAPASPSNEYDDRTSITYILL